MPMHNQFEYSDNYSTTGSLWNFYRDEVNYNANEIVGNYRIKNNKTATSRHLSIRQK